jgi:hypothetical protein
MHKFTNIIQLHPNSQIIQTIINKPLIPVKLKLIRILFTIILIFLFYIVQREGTKFFSFSDHCISNLEMYIKLYLFTKILFVNLV